MRKYRKANNVIVVLAVLFCLILNSACPPKDRVRAAIDASYRLPAATNDIIEKVRDGRDRGIITPDQSRSLGTHLNTIARAQVVFVQMVKTIHETRARTGKADAIQLAAARDYFDAEIVEPFLKVLEDAKIISKDTGAFIVVAISAAKTLIRTIARGIGSGNSNKLAGQRPDAGRGLVYA